MDGSRCCMDCGAALQAGDGHHLCPTCLGRDQLVEMLSENPCMNCSFMPHALRVARLAQMCPQDDADLPPSGNVAPLRLLKCCGESTVSVPPSRRSGPSLTRAWPQGLSIGLQAFALMTRELGHVMSFLVQARRQVWLAQSPLTKACRRTLGGVPVVSGELFGSAAVEALERTVQARQTSQQHSGLRRSMPPPWHSSRPSVIIPSAQPPPRHGDKSGGFYPREVQQRLSSASPPPS
ncbi:hypothetical protein GOODEAATRI_015106 [Goodea atripinnis]|uniref:Uncharacterized protein n=1 Tax=Goodea atripinnis TaxID=208336 RepID=A0ABV0PPF3_9TELE